VGISTRDDISTYTRGNPPTSAYTVRTRFSPVTLSATHHFFHFRDGHATDTGGWYMYRLSRQCRFCVHTSAYPLMPAAKLPPAFHLAQAGEAGRWRHCWRILICITLTPRIPSFVRI